MATTYNWSFNSLERDISKDGLDDVVVTSYWRISGVDSDDNKFNESIYGSAAIASPDPDDFTPFADVTKEQVKEWTLASLEDSDGTTEASLEKKIQDSIDLQKNPVQKNGVPSAW